MKIIVLWGGVVGVAGAWYLARAGHEVMVIDRRSAPALETSFANGGQISAGHAQLIADLISGRCPAVACPIT